MSTPFKLITLVIRTIARPLVNWVSYYNKLKLQQKESRFSKLVRGRLISIGQTTNYYNTLINRKLFKLSSSSSITELSEDKALEKGAEVLSEIFVYSILIILPIAEWIRQSKISKKKEMEKERKLKEMENELDEVIKENSEIIKEINDIKLLISEIQDKLLYYLLL
jgi:hypothetical protein